MILIPAETNSDWDTVNALMIDTDSAKELVGIVDEVNDLFSNLPPKFEVNRPSIILRVKYGTFINYEDFDSSMPTIITDFNEDLIEEPDNRLEHFSLNVWYSGLTQVIGEGKHVGEEFWADIHIKELKNIL